MRKMEQLPVIWSHTHCYCGRILPGASEEVQKQILKNVIRRGLLGSSGTLFPGWFGGPLTWRSAHTVAGPAAPGPHPLAHRCGDSWWCHDEAHCAQHHRPWGVEFRRPRQAAVPFGVLSCRRALLPGTRILCSACFQHVCMRLPVLGSSFFCILSQSTHWKC